MKEIIIQELLKKAKQLQEQGKDWHFHMLTPDCIFNVRSDKHAFVLENRTDNETHVVYSDERYMEVGQKLVKMLHGNEILDENKGTSKLRDEKIQIILQKAKELNERNIPWHHHMLFPDCIFNKHKEKWCIVFEDPEEDKTIEFVSDREPKEVLRKIEILYYKQKK